MNLPPLSLFIAEDEPPARERLIETIARVAPGARIVGHAASLLETRQWLATHAEPDVLLLDIQLADGLSIELFRDASLALPTIFTTAYDEYALAAFEALAIDYLLKPVSEARLAQAFAKVRSLRERFSTSLAEALLARLQPAPASAARQRWVGRKGAAWVSLPVEQVACFVSLDKLTFAVASDGSRVLLDESLAEVEAALDPQAFFRANRQTLVAADAVRRFTASGKGRLSLELSVRIEGQVQVPQERAATFRRWLAR